MSAPISGRILHVQSLLFESEVEALKKKAHTSSIKDAIRKAVIKYLAEDEVGEGARLKDG